MTSMRLNLWLALPETEKKLGAVLRVAVAAFACWSLAAAYGLWSVRSALAASQLAIVSQSKKLSDVVREIPPKRIEAANAVNVKIAASESAASADLTDELSRIAQGTDVEIAGVRIGDGGQGKGPAQSSPGPTNANPASSQSTSSQSAASPPASAPASDGSDQETFECNVAGQYGALTRFLNELSASRRVMEITGLEVTQTAMKTQTDTPRLEMKLSGIVYELPEKP
jgi:hypothetical protein